MKGGGKNYLPLPPTVTDGPSLCSQFDFVTMTAHGIQDGQVFIVPENTYIMFRGPAGVSIERQKRLDELLAKFRFLKAGETEAQWCNRIYDEISKKDFFKEILFAPEDPFQPGSVSIYEPGDVIQNVSFELLNMKYPYGLIGVWELPLPANLKEKINGANAKFEQLQRIGQSIAPTVNQQQIRAILDEELRSREIELISHPKNKAAQLGLGTSSSMHSTSLHEVIHNLKVSHGPLPAQFSKPYTFILVESCRQAIELGNTFHGMPEMISALEVGNDPEANLAAELARSYYEPGQNASKIRNVARGVAPILQRKRRLSLNVRAPEACYRSLFLLSRAGLTALAVDPRFGDIKRGLLEGQLVPTDLFEQMVAPARAKNMALSKVPKSVRYYIGEAFQESATGNLGIVIDFVVTSSGGAAGGAPSIVYKTKVWDGDTTVTAKDLTPAEMERTSQQEFFAIRMSLANNLQKELATPKTNLSAPPVSSAVPATIPIGAAFGKGFEIPGNLAAYQADIEAQAGNLSFKSGDIVKFTAGARKDEKVEVLPELIYSLEETVTDPKTGQTKTNPGFKKIRIQVRDSKGAVSTINPAVFEKVLGGGARGKSRSKLSGKLCRCIKRVRKTVKVRKGAKGGKESAAIGICVRSVLGKRGRTLRKFKCGKKAYVETQDPLNFSHFKRRFL